MPPKNRFQAYPGDVTKQKLEVIRKHEQDKAGTTEDGKPIKINDTWLLQNFVDVRHELIAGNVTNRQRLGGLEESVSKLTDAVTALVEKDSVRSSDIAEIKQMLKSLTEELKSE